MESRVLWYAVDADGSRYLYGAKPIRGVSRKRWYSEVMLGVYDDEFSMLLFKDNLPELTWSNDPIEIVISFSESNSKKVCKIINDRFSYVMEVDGKVITFDGGIAFEYFKQHYSELGYQMEFDMDKWKREDD